ncbi:MAG: SGNH/GDSL hydrolase family protein [Burkholderiaceae bacterium]
MLFKNHLGRFATRAAAGLAAALALASCGGGTYQEHAFVPARILTFGDESNSLIGNQGLKYSINGLNAQTHQIDCTVSPLWTQVLANSYSISYQRCNTQEVASPQGYDFSTVNATVADTANQVQAFLAGDSFNSDDLVTIWVGVHDILDDYATNGATAANGDFSSLLNDAHGFGVSLAAVVNQVANSGAKVVLLTLPDMGDSPFAYNENLRGDFNRADLLSQMTQKFNDGLRANIVNDGSKIGLVLVDDFVRNAVRSPGSYGLITNPFAEAGCKASVALPNCTDDDTVTDAGKNSTLPSIFLWADATHLAPTAHAQIGSEAVSRAHTNPF